MTPIDMIYSAVYKQCKALDIPELISKNAAVKACDDFKKNLFVTPQKLIIESVKNAKKLKPKRRK